MDRDKFRYAIRDVDAVQLAENAILFRNPLRIVEFFEDTAKTTFFSRFREELLDFDDVFDYVVSSVGQTVGTIIDGMSTVFPVLNGGGGGGSGMNTFKFNHAGGNAKGEDTVSRFPAEANVRIKAKSEEGALEEFADRFQLADHEFLYAVDSQGFVHQFNEGQTSSVGINGSVRGLTIMHNHPSGGAFSDTDMISFAMTGAKSIIASGKNGDYILKRGTHFKPEQFVRAVKNARPQGKDYDDAARRWLGDKNRQKKYGFTFQFVKASDRNYVSKDRAAQNSRARQISSGGKTYRITSVQTDMSGKQIVAAAQVYRGGKWQKVNMTSSLSATLTKRYGER